MPLCVQFCPADFSVEVLMFKNKIHTSILLTKFTLEMVRVQVSTKPYYYVLIKQKTLQMIISELSETPRMLLCGTVPRDAENGTLCGTNGDTLMAKKRMPWPLSMILASQQSIKQMLAGPYPRSRKHSTSLCLQGTYNLMGDRSQNPK